MREFQVKAQSRAGDPHFPRLGLFDPAELARHPFRTNASRTLVAALVSLTAAGAVAGDFPWNFFSSSSCSSRLAGDIATPLTPFIVETIDPDAAALLINRVFAESGFDVSSTQRDVIGTHGAEGWDAGRGVGYVIVGQEDFSSERIHAQFLERTLGEWRHLADDPRDTVENWQDPLDLEEQAELDQALIRFHGNGGHALGPNGEQVMILGVDALTVRAAWSLEQAASVEERAAAIRRLEEQVRGFIEYLRSEGVQ